MFSKFIYLFIAISILSSFIQFVSNDYIDGTEFGIVADYSNGKGTDNTPRLQRAIDECSKRGKILRLPPGKILLNSYGLTSADKAHNNIIQLKSNITILGNQSELIVGDFFDDKPFILFSGYNNMSTEYFSTLQNIFIKNLMINFQAKKSKMKTDYRLRRGVEFGHTIGGGVENVVFSNGDLTCAVATGFGGKDISKNIIIEANKFIELVSSDRNIDHSTIYLNSRNSSISKNYFKNTSTRGKLIACAAELHNSNSTFTNNYVEGYTRMNYIAAIGTENKNVSNISISGNTAKVTNAGIYLWLDDDTHLSGISINNNILDCAHVNGYSMSYNGTQGIITDAKNGERCSIQNMIVKNNIVKISKTLYKGRAVKYNTRFKFEDLNNTCEGCVDGLNFQ